VDVLVPSTTTEPLSGAGEARGPHSTDHSMDLAVEQSMDLAVEAHFTDHSTGLAATALDDNDAQSFNENVSGNEVTLSVTVSKMDAKEVSVHPLLNMGLGNEWLATMFDALPLADYTEVGCHFQNVKVMWAYWIAERASPPGCCGGGIRYLVAKTSRAEMRD
jgi:hypothetical protein